MTKDIHANIILEMMGRPPEHMKEFMEEILGKMEKEKGIEILKKKTHDAKIIERKDKDGNIIEVPKGKEMFSMFSELELKAATLQDLNRVVFAYMPSHIEILSPQNMPLQNFDMNALYAEIVRKLHEYEAIAKRAMMTNRILAKQLQEHKKNSSNNSEDKDTEKKD